MSKAAESNKTNEIKLPPLPTPKGNYKLYKRYQDLVFVCGESPILENGENLYSGRIGAELTVEQGYDAARETGKIILSILKDAAGGDLSKVEIIKVTGFIASADDFYEQPSVLNGLSDLFVEVLGERGLHARAAYPVPRLAFNCCIEAEVIAKINNT